MNNKLKKALSIFMSAALITTCSAIGSFAADNDVDYKINSTYANVDWSTYHQYKTDLHSHSTQSDASITKKENIEGHYQHNFDILAITDHGTTDLGWDDLSVNKIIKIASCVRKGNLPMEALSLSGTAANGNAYTYDGAYYTQYDENGNALNSMLRVPFGNEHNPSSFNNAHVNSWFANFDNQKELGGTSDYETPIKKADELGGLSVINHPGEYSGARNVACYDDAYDMDNFKFNYVVNKFANLLMEYHSCLGIDVNSKGDYRTRYDRKLWDILLQKVVPTGRNVFGLATSDAHNTGIINSGYTLMCMPKKDLASLRTAMEDGAFFAASYYLGSIAELNAWTSELRAAGVGLSLADKFEETSNKILEEEAERGKQSTKYSFDQNAVTPKVTSVVVDDAEDTITINTKDAYMVHWIANGEIIATGNTINLDDYSDKIGSYVRAEIVGEGGVIYTQPFTLEYDGAPVAEETHFVDLGGVTTVLADTIVKALALFLNGSKLTDLIWHFLTK